MTPSPLWTRPAWIACALMTASCAGSPVASAVATPRLTLPEAVTTPCALSRLPPDAGQADLEVAYMTRGAQIVACDGARGLAVETLLAERAMQDRWREAQTPKRPWFAIWRR